MARLSPHLHFLLRASAVLIVLSAVWWFILLDPLLAGFREAARFSGNLVFGRAPCELIRETDSGNWEICISVEGAQSRNRSVEFELARSGPIAFTFGLPVCWAVLLAIPRSRRAWRALVMGTAATVLLETLLLLLFLVTYAHAVAAQPDLARDPAKKWFYDVCQYLELNVAPALVPFLVAMHLNRGLVWGALMAAEGGRPGLTARSELKRRPRADVA